MATNKVRTIILGLILSLTAIGCVRREMVVTSDPPDADVWINEQWHGVTPFKMPFKHYGVYSVRLEKAGYYPMYIKEPIKPPLYERPGLDLISEAALPVDLQDRRELHYVLQTVNSGDEINGIIDRAEEMVARAEPLLERRRYYDANRVVRDVPLLPEKHPQSSHRQQQIKPSVPREAVPLEKMPALEMSND